MADILIQKKNRAGINPAPETEKRGKRKTHHPGDDTPSGKSILKGGGELINSYQLEYCIKNLVSVFCVATLVVCYG